MKSKNEKVFFWILIGSLFVFFEPQCFKENHYDFLKYADYIYKILKLVLSAIVLAGYIKLIKKSKYKISTVLFLVILYQLICFAATIVNNGSIVRFIGPAITTISMIVIAHILIVKKWFFEAIHIINIYFRICFFINIISIILVDYTNIFSSRDLYFLGIDNRWIFSYLPWIAFEFIESYKSNTRKIRPWIWLILVESTLIYKWSAAAMVVMLLWGMLFITHNFMKKIIKHANWIYLVTVWFNQLIVINKIQNVFKDIISNTLNKDYTLSGRTYIWDQIICDFNKQPLLGIGMQQEEYDRNYFRNSSPQKFDFLAVTHAHNTYMTNVYRFGILGLISYISIFVNAFSVLGKKSENKYSSIIFIVLIISLALGIFDTIDYSGLYFVLGIIPYLELIEEK